MNGNYKYLDDIKLNIENKLNNITYNYFNNINYFTSNNGIYFIYNSNNELEYIGAAMNIKKRCKQYITKGDKGATFRYNLIQNKCKPKLSITSIKEDKVLNSIWADRIKDEYKCKVIELTDMNKEETAYWESVCIVSFKPKLNKFNL